jgi:hypothetical protein
MPAELPYESSNDLTALLRGRVEDLRQVDFKPALPTNTDSGREEFLGDVTSFANASGGHLVYGASTGAEEPAGLEREAVASAVGWMEQATVANISPRIPGLRFKGVELPNGHSLLAVRIPKTWAGPHMVVFRNANRFYSRTETGRCLLGASALRAAFALSETYREKMRTFRLERVNAILNRVLTVRLSESPKTVLHVLPMASFQAGFHVDLEAMESEQALRPVPMGARGVTHQYNFDGLITFSSMEKYAYSYVQVFRNGSLEAVESVLLDPRDGRKMIPGVQFEKEIIACGERLLALLRALKIGPPYAVMLTLLDVRDYRMFAGPMRWHTSAHQIERDHLFMDEIVVEDGAHDFSKIMRPVFNQVWNACGWSKSLNYDEAGNWREPA